MPISMQHQLITILQLNCRNKSEQALLQKINNYFFKQIQMKKKLFSLLICFLLTNISQAQITRIRDTGTIKQINSTQTKKTSTTKLALLPDLTGSIKSIEHNNGTYTINYSIKNTGKVTADLNNISLAGNIYSTDNRFIKSGCGFTLSNAGKLNPGSEYHGTFVCSVGSFLYANNSYKYILKTDDKNIVTEANENNNTVEASITGYSSPLSSATTTYLTQTTTFVNKPDLTISLSNTVAHETGYTIYFIVKNNGQASLRVNSNGVRVQAGIINGTSTLLNSYIKLSEYNALINSGEQITSTVTVTYADMQRLNLTTGQKYTYKLIVDDIENIAESDENNNSCTTIITAR